MKKVLFVVIVILLLIAFGVSAFLVGSYLLEGKEQEKQFDALASAVASAQESAAESTEAGQTEEATVPQTTEESGMLPGYKEIYEMNPHTVGWIKIDGTELDYPVMQVPDQVNYYLERDFYGEKSKRGCIYAWESADINAPSDNITLFGHNMADGSMFAALNAYVDKEAWDQNSLIFFDTLTEYHTYQIFAVFKTTATLGEGFTYHQFVDAEDEAEFNEFVSTCKDLAFYDTGITPKYGDKLICLSTCEYTLENGRLVVAAYRIT